MIKKVLNNNYIKHLIIFPQFIFACLPFWGIGDVIICDCVASEIAIEVKVGSDCFGCCNEADHDDLEDQGICLCDGIPISRNADKHTFCFNTAGDDDNSPCFIINNKVQILENESFQHLLISVNRSHIQTRLMENLRTTVLLI